MDPVQISAAERERYLTLIERRAAKLSDVARDKRMNDQAPEAVDFLIARYVHMIVQPAAALMPAHLRAAFLTWYLEQVRDDHGLCTICGHPKRTPASLACDGCVGAMERVDEEMGLSTLTPDDLKAIAATPDGRD